MISLKDVFCEYKFENYKQPDALGMFISGRQAYWFWGHRHGSKTFQWDIVIYSVLCRITVFM